MCFFFPRPVCVVLVIAVGFHSPVILAVVVVVQCLVNVIHIIHTCLSC